MPMMSDDEKKALIYSLSHQASLMEQNAIDLKAIGIDKLISLSGSILKQSEQVRDAALFIEENIKCNG